MSTRARWTSHWWYVGALYLLLMGWVLAVVLASGSWKPARHAELHPVGTRIPDGSGLGRIAVYTDTLQKSRDITCVATSRKTKDAPARTVGLRVPDIDITDVSDDTSWHLIGTSDNGTPRSGLSIRCTPKDKGIDSASYSWAVIPDAKGAALGNGLGVIGTAAAAGLAGFVFWRRRQERLYAAAVVATAAATKPGAAKEKS